MALWCTPQCGAVCGGVAWCYVVCSSELFLTGKKKKGPGRPDHLSLGGPGELKRCVYKIIFQARKTEVCVPKIARAARRTCFLILFLKMERSGARSAPVEMRHFVAGGRTAFF